MRCGTSTGRTPARLAQPWPRSRRREGTLRAAEGILALCIAGGVSPQAAAWFCDLAALYVSAIGYEEALWIQRENSTKSGEEADHEALDAELVAFFEDAPARRSSR